MWKIINQSKRDNHKQPMYWSKELGWTWREFGDVFTDEEKETMLLPPGGEWIEVP